MNRGHAILREKSTVHDDTLPTGFDLAAYWADVRPRPLETWLPALRVIRGRHGLPDGPWHRFRRGRNVVVGLGEGSVVKLTPPFWRGDTERETAALGWLGRRLPVAVPTVVATGAIGEWTYGVQRRLPGTPLTDLWPDLGLADRVRLARHHGEIMAALHALPLDAVPDEVGFDWPRMLREQWAECEDQMRAAGVPDALLATLPAELAAARPLIEAPGPNVLLHGDLTGLNLLVEDIDGAPAITGLVDWGDAKVGPPAHDMISPGVHQYRAEREPLRAFWSGYGLPEPDRPRFAREVMARAMVFYPDTFDHYIRDVPEAERGSWSAVARAFWHLDDDR